MFIDPLQLIDQTIDHLQTLAAHFEDETNEGMPNPGTLSPDARRCKEALMTINVLIPKLRAAKMSQLLGKEPEWRERMDAQERPRLNTRQQRMCLHCED